MYIGGPAPPGSTPVTTSPEVIELWSESRRYLEALGAEIVVVPDFPVVTAYENSNLLPEECPRRPDDWHTSERGPLIAHGWNDFLTQNGETSIPTITSVNHHSIYPESMRTAAEMKVLDRSNAIQFSQLSDYIAQTSLYETKNLSAAVIALEGMRKCLLEDWLASHECHCAVFPAAGDVGAADADVNDVSAAHSWSNGVFYSNGNKALRHLGVPTVSIPMGVMKYKGMPVNLTFAGSAYDDANLLRYGNAFERKTRKRVAPPHTPALQSDEVVSGYMRSLKRAPRPTLVVDKCQCLPDTNDDKALLRLSIEGTVAITGTDRAANVPALEITINGTPVPPEDVIVAQKEQVSGSKASFSFKASAHTPRPITRDERSKTRAAVARDKTMVVALAWSHVGGYPAGWLGVL
jgi:hypothetical protein